MKIFLIFSIITAFIFTIPTTIIGQENGGEPKNEIFEQKEKQRAKERKQAEKEIKKKHASIQTKEVRKRMKKQQKRSNRLKKKKTADPFWKKWFRK